MRSCLCTSSLRSTVLLQANSVLILCLAFVATAGPSGAVGGPETAPVEYLESIVCADHATGIEFAPLGICFDIVGDLYVVDSDNSRIYGVDRDTDALTLFTECPADYPDCDFIDVAGSRAGGIYVSDRNDGLIMELDRWGDLGAYVQTGEGVAGIGEGKAGRVYAAMGIYGSVSMVDFETRTEALDMTIAQGDANTYPVDCHMVGDATLVVTDSFSGHVFFLSALGAISGAATGFEFTSPFGVTCVADRLVLVADSEQGVIAVFNSDGDFLYTFGDGILETPTFLDSTPDGLVCVSDAGKMTIEVFRIGEIPED